MKFKTKFLIPLFLFFLITSPVLSYAAKVAGTVISKQGKAFILHEGESEWKELLLRSKVYEKDTIETKEKSKVKILFLDESLMNLGENSKMEITEQNYEPGKKRVSLYNVMSGKVRVLVGKISGEESRFEVKTPTALAAVRGTELFVWVKSPTTTQVFVVDVEPGKEVVVENLQIPGVTVTVSKEFSTLIEAGAPPSQPTPATVEEIKQLFQDTAVSGDATTGKGGTGEGTGTEGTGDKGTGEGTGGEGETGEGEGESIGGGGEKTGETTSGESVGADEKVGGEVTKTVDTGTVGGDTGGETSGDTGDISGETGTTGKGTTGQDVINTPSEGQHGGTSTPPDVEKPKGKIVIKF